MPSFLMAFLKPHRMAKDVYLLTGKRAYMEPGICLEKYKRLLIRAGLDSFTFPHPASHLCHPAAWKNGFDAKSLSEILGHANVNTTLQRYVLHLSITLKQEQMNRLENISILGQSCGQTAVQVP